MKIYLMSTTVEEITDILQTELLRLHGEAGTNRDNAMKMKRRRDLDRTYGEWMAALKTGER